MPVDTVASEQRAVPSASVAVTDIEEPETEADSLTDATYEDAEDINETDSGSFDQGDGLIAPTVEIKENKFVYEENEKEERKEYAADCAPPP